MKKEYFSKIRKEQVFLEEEDDDIYFGNQKLSLMGDEQRLKSKTGSNYYYKRESDNTEFYFKIEGNNCDLTETVSDKEHSVWLENKRSLSFYRNDEHIVLRSDNAKKNEVIDKQEANNILNAQNNNLFNQTPKKYFNPIKNEEIYLRELNGEIYLGAQKLSLMGDEQKLKIKTGSNYYYKRESDNTEFYFKIEGNNFSLTETVSEEEHSVWLQNKRSLSFYRNDEHIVLRSDNANKNEVIDKQEANNILNAQNNNLFDQKPKKYFDSINNKDIYLTELNGEIYFGNQKLSLMGDEQKLKSKTNSNYYYKRESDGREFYFKLEGNNFSLTETVSREEHSVWLSNQRSLSFYGNDENIVLRSDNAKKNEVINKQEANNILDSQNQNLINQKSKKYFDPIKNQDIYLRELNGEIYWGEQKLSLMGNEQKLKSKTNSNYYYKRESDGMEFYFKLEGNNFSLTETLSNNCNTVWLKDNKSLSFNDSIKDVVYSDNNKSVSPSTLISREDAIKMIAQNHKNDNEVKNTEIKEEKISIISSIKSIRDKLFGNNHTNENKLKR